jgi:hypothetical protein
MSPIESNLTIAAKPKRPRLTRADHWRLFRRDVRLALAHLWSCIK